MVIKRWLINFFWSDLCHAGIFTYILFGGGYYSSVFAMDRSHWYRATPVISEPRLEKAWLATWSSDLSTGHTSHALNAQGKKVPLLDIYGKHNLALLGSNISLDQGNYLDRILIALLERNAQEGCSQSSLDGSFHVNELYWYFTQNFRRGFFTEIVMPFREFCIDRIRWTKDSSVHDVSVVWKEFAQSCSAIMRRYGILWDTSHIMHMGDTTLLCGWTINYQETNILDYIDSTVACGCLFPTGYRSSLAHPFALPTGYDGHYGIPFLFDFSFGLYEWLTIGCHVDTIPFFSRTGMVRMKTDLHQSDLIQLAVGKAHKKSGPLTTAELFIKADHVVWNFSWLISYSCAHKARDYVVPCDTVQFDMAVVNTNQKYSAWTMHTINFLLEGDFSKEDCPLGPRMALFYNVPVAGRRIFKTSMGGMQIGIDITYCY